MKNDSICNDESAVDTADCCAHKITASRSDSCCICSCRDSHNSNKSKNHLVNTELIQVDYCSNGCNTSIEMFECTARHIVDIRVSLRSVQTVSFCFQMCAGTDPSCLQPYNISHLIKGWMKDQFCHPKVKTRLKLFCSKEI